EAGQTVTTTQIGVDHAARTLRARSTSVAPDGSVTVLLDVGDAAEPVRSTHQLAALIRPYVDVPPDLDELLLTLVMAESDSEQPGFAVDWAARTRVRVAVRASDAAAAAQTDTAAAVTAMLVPARSSRETNARVQRVLAHMRAHAETQQLDP